MLSRFFISRSASNLRLLKTLISSNNSLPSPPPPLIFSNPNIIFPTRFFSTNRNNNNGGGSEDPNLWKISSLNEENEGASIFGDEDPGDLSGINDGFEIGSKRVEQDDSWSKGEPETGDIFADVGAVTAGSGDISSGIGGAGEGEWETAEGFKPWSFDEEEKGEDLFDIGEKGEEGFSIGEIGVRDEGAELEKAEANAMLEKEKEGLKAQLKGPNRAFGDLVAASGITSEMLDSLIALKDLEGIEGLPPLEEIENIRLEKNERKSTRAEIERKKQEEIAKSRVRQVDEQGRAYGTGRRKCSIARVWIQPGNGQFIVNDKPFDTYFPILDHRADLLRPFSETKTLGLWDVKCTVKGGGVSGQVGAVRLGVSRALQNWEPGLRPNLRSAGFLTRDSRVVERKKPGKAKARKSFQWVKR